MASYGNTFVSTNLSFQRPLKTNWRTGLQATEGTSTVSILEQQDQVGSDAATPGGLQKHSAYDIRLTAPTPASASQTLTITIPGTSTSSAYKPVVWIEKTAGAQESGGANEEAVDIRRSANNEYVITRQFVESSASPANTTITGDVRVCLVFTANTDGTA